MEYDLIKNIETCYVEVPDLLFYSHIPTSLVSVVFGFFLFLKDRKSITTKVFLLISLLFFSWSLFDLAAWINPSQENPGSFLYTIFSFGVNSGSIMFFWSLMCLFEPMIFIFLFYFCYTFLENKDLSYKQKIILFSPLIPIVVFLPFELNIEYFDNPTCESVQGRLIYYIYFVEILFSLFSIFLIIKKYISQKNIDRNKLLYFFIGVLFFLVSFSWTNIIGGNLGQFIGVDISSTESWAITQYGLFGMPVFLGFLSYLILKYQAFNVKVIATQYFIVIIWLLVASQLALGQEDPGVYVPMILSLLVVSVAGFWLFRIMGQEEATAVKLKIAHGKLSKINDKLKEISRAKSEFISIASHQLRTPLTSIKGYTCLILEKTFGAVPQKQKEALEKVLINNEKLVLLVEDMLNVSRLEAGRLEYDFEKQKLLPIIEDAVSNLKLYAKNKNLSLKLLKCRDAKDLEVIADTRKVFEILSNLVDNAIKYTAKGSIEVSVRRIKHLQKIGKSKWAGIKKTDWVKISIKDSGMGIDKKDLELIFEKYKKGGALTGGSTPASTGLGIYISRQMAKAHGGRLYAQSQGKNKGSTFVFSLPLAQENGGTKKEA